MGRRVQQPPSLSLQTLLRAGCDASTLADPSMRNVLIVLFALALGRQTDACSSLARWHTTGEKNTGTFGRQALGMVWDFAEVNPFSGATGSWDGVIEWVARVCESQAATDGLSGQVEQASATAHPLSDDIASAWITDPPYYDAVPYAHLSDYFYSGSPRVLKTSQPQLFGASSLGTIGPPKQLSMCSEGRRDSSGQTTLPQQLEEERCVLRTRIDQGSGRRSASSPS